MNLKMHLKRRQAEMGFNFNYLTFPRKSKTDSRCKGESPLKNKMTLTLTDDESRFITEFANDRFMSKVGVVRAALHLFREKQEKTTD